MTDYTDVPKVNALHVESQQVAQAIANLEAGGTVSTMTVEPPPPSTTPPVPGEPIPVPPMMMTVFVTFPPPIDPAVLASTIAWLNQRLVEIAAELTTLGVTVPPTGSAAWSTPPAPPGMPMMQSPMMQPPIPPSMTPPPAPVNPNPHAGD